MNVAEHKPAPLAPAPAADSPWKQRVRLGIIVLLLPTSLYFIYRHFQGPSAVIETMPNRPMLKSEGKEFYDRDTRVRFTPPPRWSMQLRSTEMPDDDPTTPADERGRGFWWLFAALGLVVGTSSCVLLFVKSKRSFTPELICVALVATAVVGYCVVQGLAAATPAAAVDRGDRMIVKFKRLLPNQPAASFRVLVGRAPADQDVAEYVKKRNPGQDWRRPSAISSLTVGGLPAAKIQYSALYNGVPSLRDIIGVRRGSQVFYFIATYPLADRSAQEECRQTMSTVLFEQS